MLYSCVLFVFVMWLKVLCCIVGNLVDNVLKFVGVVEIDVWVVLDGGVVIVVFDCGFGILDD